MAGLVQVKPARPGRQALRGAVEGRAQKILVRVAQHADREGLDDRSARIRDRRHRQDSCGHYYKGKSAHYPPCLPQ
jgi:hypothetical protein